MASDLTIEVLREIRDGIRELREDFNARLDQTNPRLDQTNQRLKQTNERLERVEHGLNDPGRIHAPDRAGSGEARALPQASRRAAGGRCRRLEGAGPRLEERAGP